ncbi:phytase [Galbibacter orientalis]|uniref:3-phytase (Myo-inositol-hexaphosphate 3-phosphohydrolase) n=1 Tax=Galbibacter orientalis DSM 19592 TaxID=926559 RepID=I3C519_9FLAO|nr:phytase [Galbibacter orientalis]EIJ38712.1 3-phytase (myo-inositol-hexaphosphate 3-phosphohydrolase) [Galbibacter orientalis DSM 19592]
MKIYRVLALTALVVIGCKKNNLPAISPDVITESTLHDTDDPAIWVNKKDPSKSIVFGTDKDTDGAIYAFDLEGKIIESKTIRGLKRPNNVDLRYDFQLNDSTKVDVLAFTERERQQIRLFSIPDMKPLDGGGFPVFTDVTAPEQNLPMGISLYHSEVDGAMYAIVGRKTGPLDGYLYQYILKSDSLGVKAELVRKFGKFSGKKEIEAIAVDDKEGIVYYSDEGAGIHKYYAEPSKGNEELAFFGGEYFLDDIEGLCIADLPNGESYIIVSNQQNHSFVIFNKNTHEFVKELNLSTQETDGCEIVTTSLTPVFKDGLFVAMNNDKRFFFYNLGKLL